MFCVNATLSGEGESLKESTIGVSVFNRDPGYNTKLDPIVRVTARRLRQKLELFYLNESDTHPVQITFPKGTYVPQFGHAVVESQTAREHSEGVSADLPILPKPPVPEMFQVRWGARFWWLVALAICLLVVALIFSRAPRTGNHAAQKFRATQRFSPPSLHDETSLPGTKADPSFSPDGKKFAFSWVGTESGVPRVYLQQRGSEIPILLTQTPYPELRPVWSGDGSRIALLRQTKPGVYQIVLVDVATRSERILRSVVYARGIGMPALDWSRDGKWIVSNEQQGDEPAHLILISTETGVSQQLTDPPDGSTGDLEARFSPTGTQIAFRRGQLGELFVASLDSSGEASVSQLTFTNPGVQGLTWSSDGQSIYFGSVNGGSKAGIWRFKRIDSSMVLVTPSGLAAVSPNLSRDGREIIFSAPRPEFNLWQFKADGSYPRPLGSLTAMEITPSVSPDGKMIVFASDMSGNMELWVSAIDTSAPRQLTRFGGDGIPVFPSWSADSRRIAFFCRRKGLNYAYDVGVQGGTMRLLRGGTDYTLYPQYSPDNKWLYFLSNRGHRFRLWRLLLDNLTAPPEEITMQNVTYFRLAKDGKTLYFASHAGTTTYLISKDLQTGRTQTVWKWDGTPLGLGDWDISGNRLYFLAPDPASLASRVVMADLATQTTRELGKVPTNYWFGINSISAAPDGGSVWISKLDRDDGNIMSLRLQ